MKLIQLTPFRKIPLECQDPYSGGIYVSWYIRCHSLV